MLANNIDHYIERSCNRTSNTVKCYRATSPHYKDIGNGRREVYNEVGATAQHTSWSGIVSVATGYTVNETALSCGFPHVN